MYRSSTRFLTVVMLAMALGAAVPQKATAATGEVPETPGSKVPAPPKEIAAEDAEFVKQLEFFENVLQRIRADYVDKPDSGKLIRAAVKGMLGVLDPHSVYYPPVKQKEVAATNSGQFGGLGIEVTMENGVIKVVTPIDDTPADRAGLSAGDLITHLDGEQVQGLTLAQAVGKMRGRVGTTLTVTIVPNGRAESFDIKITRAIIKVVSVKSRAENDVGYLRITFFTPRTVASLKQQVAQLKTKIGADLAGYILDLRNCPGGTLDASIAVADEFLETGAIVTLRGRGPNSTGRNNATSGDITNGAKLIVLINGGTAGGAEIFAGALKDHERATVIGTRSFGSGTSKTIIPFGANGAIRLTTSRYYTPSGHAIQAQGIEPNIVIEQVVPERFKKSEKKKTGESTLKGHLKGEGLKEKTGSSAYVPKDKSKDLQLQYALTLLRGGPSSGAPTGAGPDSPDLTGLDSLE